MTPEARRAWPRVAWLCGLSVIAALSAPSQAQTAPQGSPAQASAYQDRYIAGGTLSPDISTGDYGTTETSGLARSIRTDSVGIVLDQEGPNSPPRTHENGLLAGAQWDTVSYGAWSADAAARTGGARRPGVGHDYGAASFSLHERGMPFDDGWQADHALGDINAPLISLARTDQCHRRHRGWQRQLAGRVGRCVAHPGRHDAELRRVPHRPQSRLGQSADQ